MTVRTMPVPPEAGVAACSNPEHLPLVDAAHDRPGGPEADLMKRTLCAACPVAAKCLDWAMTHAEAGIWGGTSPRSRTVHGAPNRLRIVADRAHRTDKAPAPRKPDASTVRLQELGVTASTVKRWAYDHGLVDTYLGRVALTTIEAWANAHQAA